MTNPTVAIAAQYVQSVHANALVRPYQNKSPMGNQVSGEMNIEALPEEFHWRLTLGVGVLGVNQEGVPCFDCGCTMEAIVVAVGMDEAQVRHELVNTVASLVFANIRTQLSTVSLATGYGPVTLPPMSADRLAAMLTQPDATQT